MDTSTCLVVVALLFVLAITTYHRATRYSIKHIRGPSGSFFRGNIRKFFYQTNVGDMDFQYTKEYGLVWRMAAPLGEDILMIADPKALQHIFHKSGYTYAKHIETVVNTSMVAGHSILYTPTAVDHSRHRRVMNPAFSAHQLRSFLPLFRKGADKLCYLLKEQALPKTQTESHVVVINEWLSRTTLDVIGETAFHFDFGALDNSKNAVSEAYENMFVESRLYPTLVDSIFRATWRFFPCKLVEYVKYLPRREYSRFRRTKKVIDKVSNALVDQAVEEAKRVEIEKGKKDVMSVLVRANMSETPSLRLSKDEMVSQMAALTLAGHATTATTLTWLLWELAQHPEFQGRLRQEIRDKREEIACGPADASPDFSVEDLESMPFLQAVLKEVLRYHPILYHRLRVADKDDVIPISEPLTTVTGEVIDQIPIGKGQTLMFSICVYNRIKKIWGEDADVFNPMRFIDGRVENEFKVGMYSGLMTFSAGLRGCIGWRFSLIEMQAILVALIENFEFTLPPKELGVEIMRVPLGLMAPMMKGKFKEGVQMPLNVRALKA